MIPMALVIRINFCQRLALIGLLASATALFAELVSHP
jgi:hypothetical protein